LLEAKVLGSFAIEVDVWSHKHTSDDVRERNVEWSVYISDQQQHYKSAHLANAVEEALANYDEAVKEASKVSVDDLFEQPETKEAKR